MYYNLNADNVIYIMVNYKISINIIFDVEMSFRKIWFKRLILKILYLLKVNDPIELNLLMIKLDSILVNKFIHVLMI